MKVRELIANLQKENMENEIFIKDKNFLLDVFEVIDGKMQDGDTFSAIIPDKIDFMESMNRWKLTDEIKEKNKPVIQKFLNKMEKVRSDEIENMDNNEFCIDLSDTGLRPYTLLELMKNYAYMGVV